MSTGSFNRHPAGNPDSLSRRLEAHRKRYSRDSFLTPVGPKPPGKRPPPTSHSERRARGTTLEQIRETEARLHEQVRVDRHKAARERILNAKPTLEQRLAAIPAPDYTPIVPKPVILNFEKLTTNDIIRILEPKFNATLQRFDVFECFEFAPHVPKQHIDDIFALRDRLTSLKRTLRDNAGFRTKFEVQGWNYGFAEIGRTSFKGLRANQALIAKQLSLIWRSNYFEFQ